MAQTPARDIIKDAVVDFRFYNGDTRNYANNENVLEWETTPSLFGRAHGVPAAVVHNGGFGQDWMLATTDVATFEVLFAPRMDHLIKASTEGESDAISDGTWVIRLYQVSGGGDSETSMKLDMCFNYTGTDDSYITQRFTVADVPESMFKGVPLHLVISVRSTAGVSMEVTTYINGVYATKTTVEHTYFNISAPTNVLLGMNTTPTYLFRMWEQYISDELVLADLFREAKRIFPLRTFTPVANEIIYAIESGGGGGGEGGES